MTSAHAERRRQAAHARRRRPKPPRRALPRQVDVDELALRLTHAPSRQGMARPRPKADYLEHAWHFYNALWRRAHGDRTAHFDTTWGQLAAACDYPDTAKVRGSLQRYAAALQELGLARVAGVVDQAGAWQRLDVELLHPPDLADWLPVSASGHARVWHRRDLSGCQRRRLHGRPRGGRAARRDRLELGIRRIVRRPNLSSPLGLALVFDKGQPIESLPGRTHRREPVDERGRRDWSGQAATPPPDRQDVGAIAETAKRRNNCSIEVGGLEAEIVRTAIAGGLQAALDRLLTLTTEGRDPVELVELGWQLLNPTTPARLGCRRRDQLRTALATLDRFAAFGAGQHGAGVDLAIRRMQADVAEPVGRLESLSGVAAWLWSTGRQWRRTANGKNPRPDRPRPRPQRRPDAWEWPEE